MWFFSIEDIKVLCLYDKHDGSNRFVKEMMHKRITEMDKCIKSAALAGQSATCEREILHEQNSKYAKKGHIFILSWDLNMFFCIKLIKYYLLYVFHINNILIKSNQNLRNNFHNSTEEFFQKSIFS